MGRRPDEEESPQVYLKTLTLRGFKSFASATTLRFEPGITCVVGPNGSGKSNVVDAFSWVMGEQGVKTLRGGKMEDVVFAGTSSRPPLGRAEVTLTIDNSDGALPIDYTEVTISRLLFRSGQSEYAINGNHCRLLDVAELLSDSGLGREMHVIVGQGQVDDVLQAGPEARRALIEEAAGVLKHRRRKEKALRKLEAMQANLTRLVDLTGELRRRLGPLGRQAALARRAAVIQADLRDARLRLLADDYVTVAADLERGQSDETAALARRGELEQALAQARLQESSLDAAEQEHAPRLAQAQEVWFSLSSLAERLRGVGRVAQERHSHLVAEPEPPRPGRDPDQLDAEAALMREQEAELGERLEAARAQLAGATGARETAEAELAEAERRLAAQARAAAARAERLARLRGQVGAARSRVAAAREEEGRLADALDQAQSRAKLALREYEEFQDASAGRDDDRAGLAAAHEQATTALGEVTARVTELRAAERRASAERAALVARREALEEGIRAVQRGAEASEVLLADPVLAGEVLGAVAGLLTVADGAQQAVTAALGGAADAVAVAGLDAAVTILRQLKAADAGSTALVIAGGESGQDPAGRADIRYPPGVLPALDLVKAPGELYAALAGLLAGVVVAADLDDARHIVRAHPELRVVTRDGDLLGAHWAQGGAARPPSVLAMRSAADTAAADLTAADGACEVAAAGLAAAMAEEERAQQAVAGALALMQEADAAAAAVSGQLGRLAGAARAAQDEAARLAAAIAAAREKAGQDEAALTELSARLAAEEASETPPAPGPGAGPASGSGTDQAPGGAAADGPESAADEAGEADGIRDAVGVTGGAGGAHGATDAPQRGTVGEPAGEPDRETLTGRASAARETETNARLEVRTAEERLRAIAGRADALAAAAVSERQAARAAAERGRLRRQQARVARAVAEGAGIALERLEQSLTVATADRRAAEQAREGRSDALKTVRAQVRELAEELDRVVDSAHGAEIVRAEHRMRLEQIAFRAVDEFGVDATALVAEYGPDVPVPEPAQEAGAPAPAASPADGEPIAPPPDGDGPARPTIPYVRAAQEQRAAVAQRQLNQLGKVNPLALEEYGALEERHAYLARQLEDLKKTRRDLLTVVKEVDDRVQQVFAAAFEDTAREFEQIFGRLFPGGQGRLILTEPDDMLATGIDFEARPPGKKVKRLSLLSGGERSMTAIAFLVAIFKARPSPFYVLDEVEAALDDTNLQRLMQIFEELRDNSQLIIVTHQKRTMETADALYGISMQGDGVSSVVSQRLREPEHA
ncbi:MAG TPA: AAA family ATPase [Streptosporangiaceae bacterium]|nr:AAA family ATPase [Streptosporangiaceae bacterium]